MNRCWFHKIADTYYLQVKPDGTKLWSYVKDKYHDACRVEGPSDIHPDGSIMYADCHPNSADADVQT